MKRIVTVCVVFLMAAVLSCSVCFAAEPPAAHHLDVLDADIALPSWENYYFLYPDMAADNEDLEYLGMTPEQVNASLEPDGILLDVMYCDFSHEFLAYVSEDTTSAEIYNFRELSALEREIVLSANTSMYAGVELLCAEWMEADNALWLVVEYRIPDNALCRQYSTVYNGKMLCLDAVLYISEQDYTAVWTEVCAVADDMVTGTVFNSTEETPEGVGGITGNLITDVLDDAGMSTIDLSDAGLGVLDLNEVDLSDLDLDGVVDALGLTEEEAIMLVKGEMDPTEIDLSKADAGALIEAVGMEQDELVDVAMDTLGLGDLDWRGILAGVGRGALIGTGAAAAVLVLIIVLLAVCGSKKRSAAAGVSAEGGDKTREE